MLSETLRPLFMEGTIYAYVTPPIDSWYGARKLKEVIHDPRFDEFEQDESTDFTPWFGVKELENLFELGQTLAMDLDWDGDIRQGPYVIMIPAEGFPCLMPVIAWKQDNNGTTFIVSPVRLTGYDEEVVWNFKEDENVHEQG